MHGGPAAFAIRAVLAAMMSPTWGVYSGFELYEHLNVRAGQRGVPRLREVPAAPARLRRRDRRRPLAGAAARQAQPDPPRAPGAAPAAQPALPRVDNGDITAFSKRDEETGDTVLVRRAGRSARVARGNDRRWTCRRSAWTGTPLLGARPAHGGEYEWGEHNYVRLDPHRSPAHVFQVRLTRRIEYDVPP